MKKLLLLAVYLLSLTAQAQVRYEVRRKNNVFIYTPETLAGSSRFDGTPTTILPPGAVTARLASTIRMPWTPEAAKRTLNLGQFGTGGTKSLFKLSNDFRPAEYSHDQWRSFGFNMISKWSSDKANGTDLWSNVPENQRFEYEVEGSLYANTSGGPRRAGHYFYTATLAEMEATFSATIPVYGPGAHWCANIEETNYWAWDQYDSPHANYPPWDAVKNQQIQLESLNETWTLERLRNDVSRREIEQNVRRANRNSIMLQWAGRNGAWVAFGSSMYQGEPRLNALTTANRFLDDGGADVGNIVGSNGQRGSNGTIVLNGHTYTNISGSFYRHETYHLDYHYYFDYSFTGSNYESITDYPTLWPYISNRHPIAREIGHWLANQKRMKEVHGGNTIPTVRMHEIFYEGNFSRAPSAMGLNNGDGGSTKTWIPPYLIRLQYMLTHILEGERAGAGYHIFHSAGAPNQGIEYNLSSNQRHNHHLHTLSALVAARRDMETILDKLPGTTLYTDVDISVGNTDNFESLNGVTAYAFGADGGQGTTKPCFVMRTKTTADGTYVLLAGGFDHGWNDTRTDAIKVPGTSNIVQVTYKGKDLQVFETLIPAGTVGQTFTAKSIVSQWEKPGYGGRINNDLGGLSGLILLGFGLGTALRSRRAVLVRLKKPDKKRSKSQQRKSYGGRINSD